MRSLSYALSKHTINMSGLPCRQEGRPGQLVRRPGAGRRACRLCTCLQQVEQRCLAHRQMGGARKGRLTLCTAAAQGEWPWHPAACTPCKSRSRGQGLLRLKTLKPAL